MNWIARLFPEELIQALGWTLLHSLWQGLLIALLLTLAFLALRRHTPATRHLAALTALAALFVCALTTFEWVYAPGGETAADLGVVIDPTTDFPADPAAALGPASSSFFREITDPYLDYFGPHLPLVVLIWLLGVTLLSLRTLGELVFIQHLRYNRSRPAGSEKQAALEGLARRLGIRRPVQLRESLRIHSPMVVGILRPVVLVPVGLWLQLTPKELEGVLAHELAHIRRHDYLVNLLQSLAEVLFFFNPAVWWISAMIRAEREHSCDDLAIEMVGDELTFVKTLAHLETYREQHLGLAVGLAGSRGSVLGRIQRILHGDQPAKIPFRIFWSIVFMTLFAGAAAFSVTRAELPGEPLQEIRITQLDTMPPAASAIVGEALESPEEIGISVGASSAAAETVSSSQPADLPSEGAVSVQSASVAEGSAAFRSEVMPWDTVPPEARELQRRLLLLQQEQHEKMLVIEQQMNELSRERMDQERELQEMQNEIQGLEMEIQQEMEHLSSERNFQEREWNIQQKELENQVLDLEAQMEKIEDAYRLELSKEIPDQEKIRSLESAILETREKIRTRHKELNKMEVDLQRQVLATERQMQQLHRQRTSQERDLQKELNDQQLELLQLQHEMEQLQIKKEMILRDFELRMQKERLERQN